MKNHGKLILGTALVGVLALVGMYLYRGYLSRRSAAVISFLNSPDTHPDWKTPALIFAARGTGLSVQSFPEARDFVGYLWGDSFKTFFINTRVSIFLEAARWG